MAKKSSKKSKANKEKTVPPSKALPQERGAPVKRAAGSVRGINKPVLVLALVGMGLTAYLSYTSWFGVKAAFCGEGSSCDLVQESRWGSLLGLPMAFWGFMAYATLGYIAVRIKRKDIAWQLAWLVAFTGLAISVYLTAISLVVIQATCPYCLGSLALMTVLTGVLAWQQPGGIEGFRWPLWLLQTGGVAAVVVLVLHLHYSGVFVPSAGPEDPYLKALAIHLSSEKDNRFYGAFWCPSCQQQKEIFGPSASRLPYYECSPNGRKGPSGPECLREKVTSFPTWIVGRQRFTGVTSAEELASRSGFVWKGARGASR